MKSEQSKNFENSLENQNVRFENETREDLIQIIEKLEKENAELVAKNIELKESSIRDQLTGTHNRRGLLETEKERRNSEIKQSAVLILDIDNFKSINDTYGHNIGDEVLRQVAVFLKEKIRETDALSRWGGEEFVIIMKNIDAKKVLQKFYNKENGQASISFNVTTSLNGNETKIPITLSGGATDIIPEENIQDTIARADKELYRAKEDGKNRIYRPEEKFGK